MLSKLHIKNIALIDDLEIDFYKGFNVLSGETGAGKSIIVDSLNFILGAKADKTLLRYGEKSALVEAVFDLDDELVALLKSEDFDFFDDNDGILILSRTLNVSGKSECRANGRIITASNLKKLTSFIVDLHGQHEHQSLLNSKNHINILDNFLPSAIKNDLFAQADAKYQILLDIKKELKTFGGSEAERIRTLDILNYQINEIQNAALNETEESELKQKRQRIMYTEKITSALAETMACFENAQDGGIIERIYNASKSLDSAAKYDAEIAALSDRLNSAKYELDDIFVCIGELFGSFDFDAGEADIVEKRLDVYKDLKRKYGDTVPKIYQFLEVAQAEYDKLKNASDRIEKLNAQKDKAFDKLFEIAQKISAERKKAAQILEREVINELGDLGMKNCAFEVCFNDVSQETKEKQTTQRGYDFVEFFISANKGEPIKPLSKIISGGETSRVMLALKAISGEADQISTMVFDEIDTGISGKIGQEIAKKLARISSRHQILCVTHLPQIAAMADAHFLITKQSDDTKTSTFVTKLNEAEIYDELARLSGGKGISESALKQAAEIWHWSQNFKKGISS